MSVYKGPTVTISGTTIFKDYKKGFIEIVVLDKEPKAPKEEGQMIIALIALERIPKPGFYEIRVPKKIGKVYIIVRNLDAEDISKIPVSPSVPIGIGEYVKNPVKVGNQDINSIDIEIKTVKNIPTQVLLK